MHDGASAAGMVVSRKLDRRSGVGRWIRLSPAEGAGADGRTAGRWMPSAVLRRETMSLSGMAMINDFDLQSFACRRLIDRAPAGGAGGGVQR
ncbi:protein of unknown function [Burkholderia multivorans]